MLSESNKLMIFKFAIFLNLRIILFSVIHNHNHVFAFQCRNFFVCVFRIYTFFVFRIIVWHNFNVLVSTNCFKFIYFLLLTFFIAQQFSSLLQRKVIQFCLLSVSFALPEHSFAFINYKISDIFVGNTQKPSIILLVQNISYIII